MECPVVHLSFFIYTRGGKIISSKCLLVKLLGCFNFLYTSAMIDLRCIALKDFWDFFFLCLFPTWWREIEREVFLFVRCGVLSQVD